MEETAYWLDLTVPSDKPIVLIGAQRNASAPDFDGPRNLLNAVRIAVDPGSVGKGTLLAMNNQINAARDVTKISTRVLNGRVLPNYGFGGGGKTLAAAGAVLADDLRPHKARILLMLALQSGFGGQTALQAVFDR